MPQHPSPGRGQCADDQTGIGEATLPSPSLHWRSAMTLGIADLAGLLLGGHAFCISCLPEHLQESAYRYTESLDMLAAGPEREAGDGTPLRSAICSLAPASSERHPHFHMHFTPTSGSGSLRTLSD